MKKSNRHFASKTLVPTEKGAIPAFTVDLDKNGQICGGSFLATHRGRPCKLENGQLLCPVTSWDEDKEMMAFVEWEILIADVK